MLIKVYFDIVLLMLSPDQSRSEQHIRGTHLLDEVTAVLRSASTLRDNSALRDTSPLRGDDSFPKFAAPPIEDVVAALHQVTPHHQLGFVSAISNSVDFLLQRMSSILATSHRLTPPQPLPPGVVVPPPEVRLKNEDDVRQLAHTFEQIEYALDLASALGKQDLTHRALAQMQHKDSAPRLLHKIYALVGIAVEVYPELDQLPCVSRWAHRVNHSLTNLSIPESIHRDFERRLRILSGEEILHSSTPDGCIVHIGNLVRGAGKAFPGLEIALAEPLAGANDAVIATTTNHQRTSTSRTKLLIVPRYSGAFITFNQINGVNILVSGIIALALEGYALRARTRVLSECRPLSTELLASSHLPALSNATAPTNNFELLGACEDQHWLVAADLFSGERSFWGGFIRSATNRVLKRLGFEIPGL